MNEYKILKSNTVSIECKKYRHDISSMDLQFWSTTITVSLTLTVWYDGYMWSGSTGLLSYYYIKVL